MSRSSDGDSHVDDGRRGPTGAARPASGASATKRAMAAAIPGGHWNVDVRWDDGVPCATRPSDGWRLHCHRCRSA